MAKRSLSAVDVTEICAAHNRDMLRQRYPAGGVVFSKFLSQHENSSLVKKIHSALQTGSNDYEFMDPLVQKDFGVFQVDNHRVVWRIVSLGMDPETISEKPWNAQSTRRILFIATI